jgi:hypothetical protein
VSRKEFKKYGELKESEAVKLRPAEQSEIRKKFFEMVRRRMQFTAGLDGREGAFWIQPP